MRRRAAGAAPIALALALAWAGVQGAAAESDLGFGIVKGEATLGVRGIGGSFSSAEYEEYREQRPGLFGSGSFLLEDPERRGFFRGWLEDVGEHDERYALEAGRYGRYRLELEYDELPHVYSNFARSLYSTSHDAVLTLPAGLQASLEALSGAAQSTALGAALSDARSKSLELRLRTGRVGLVVQPTEMLRLEAGYRIQDKRGTRPFGIGFGSPGSNFVNVASPLDERLHEVTGGIELAKDDWSVGLGYIGSLFQNDFRSLTVANPLRATDSLTAGAAFGRSALAPDNSAHTFRLEGATALPTSFPARLAATFSYGMRLQTENFVAHTINSTLLGSLTPLGRNDLDGDVRTILGNVVLTGRPLPKLHLTARYRVYDYDNRTSVVDLPEHVVNDRSLVAEERFTVPNDYRRHNATLDGSYRLTDRTTMLLGYAFEQWDRSNDRERTLLYEHGGKAGFDLRPARWALLRTTYEFGIRRGNDYRGFAHLAHAVAEEDLAGAQSQSQLPQLRKFDEADRIRIELSVLTQLFPLEQLEVTFSGGLRRDEFDRSHYGLTDANSWNVGLDSSYRASSRLAVSAYYGYEDIRSRQCSRWRPVNNATGLSLDDVVNDWTSRSGDEVHNAGFAFDFTVIPERLDARLGYGFQAALAKTRAGGRPGFAAVPPSTVDGGNTPDYPEIEDFLHVLSASLSYRLLERVTLTGEYRWELFDLQNFKTESLNPFMPDSNVNGSGVVSPSTDVFLGDRVEDYSAHVFALSISYRF